MHGPTDSDRKRKPLTPEQIEANRIAAHEYRVRQKRSVAVFPGRIGPGAINAMVARNMYLGGMSREEAERLARDPDEISRLVYDVLESVFAYHWFDLMKKLRRSS